MSIVLPATMTKDEAERLSTRIGLRLDVIADNYIAVMPMIREAIERQAYAALGYKSHGAYVQDRFGEALAKVGVELRREIVRELTDVGLTTRAIAPIVGTSHMTVARDLAPVTPVTPPEPQTPAQVSDTHHEFPTADEWSPDEGFVNAATGEVREKAPDEVIAPEPIVPEPRRVTGLDGKTYNVLAAKPKPELTRESQEQANASQAVKSLSNLLTTGTAYTYPRQRDLLLHTYYPASKEELPPAQRELFTPGQLRAIATGLNELATELEADR